MIDPMVDREFADLTEKIARERGFGCASYKERCLRRRIAVRMRACGVHTFTDYGRLLDHDAHEYERLLDALTINVTKLFRNWDTFQAIDRLVVPALLARPAAPLVIWSAGCASGEEAHSLGILVHRYAVEHGDAEWLDRVTVIGTDIDRASLDAARRGAYADAAFADTPRDLRARYFSAAAPHVVDAEVRRLVRFEQRDLLREPPPAPAVHLIACRNVLIYFDRHTQEMLFQRFYDALAPGGFLVLGKVETLFGPVRSRFQGVDPRERIYRRQ